ncbi:MAG: PrsW family intramembrane metalloprotease, partial [Lachnospiraceae bacterium]|nr:PrsW family intramembrane metalloprotease [Lachnospiraceae bacterium]
MIIICYFLSLAVSASILIWLIKLKKKDPFPKNSILWMLLWGVWGCAVSSVFCAGLEIAMMIRKLGFDTVYAVFMESTGDNFEDNIDALMAVRGGPSFLSLFWEGFITAAIPEEIVKFFITREFIINKKLAAKDTIFNSIMCCSFVALGFQMVEDFMYVNGGILSAI